MSLSKSKFVAGVQCLKRLYLQVHEPNLAAEPNDLTEAVFSQGREVGLLAQEAFPGGVTVEAGHTEIKAALARTKDLVANPEIPAIFEAAFLYEDIVVQVDILERLSRNRWRMIEVKSSTRVKNQYLFDVAIQQHVVAGCGLTATQACLMHLNRSYVYNGCSYELESLFTTRDLTKKVKQLGEGLPALLREQWRILAQSTSPEIDPGRQCTAPVVCEFYDHCNAPLPEDHVSRLPGIQSIKVGSLLEHGYSSIRDIPPKYPLTQHQRRACDCVQTGAAWFGDALRTELDQLIYPLYFMDFETINPAIPRHEGMCPYDMLPFQWSIHVQKEAGAEIVHHQFLADDNDPREEFIDSLCNVVKGSGNIVVYSQSFESSRLSDLARWVPKFANRIAQIQIRLWDLLAVMRKHVYHPQFGGSFSLKRVLPALIPGMTYEGMSVSEGSEAGLAWEKMIRDDIDGVERERLRKGLLAYCRQDTLAMVKLLERLQQK